MPNNKLDVKNDETEDPYRMANGSTAPCLWIADRWFRYDNNIHTTPVMSLNHLNNRHFDDISAVFVYYYVMYYATEPEARRARSGVPSHKHNILWTRTHSKLGAKKKQLILPQFRLFNFPYS